MAEPAPAAGGPEIAWQNAARSRLEPPLGWLGELLRELAPAADSLGVRLVSRREMQSLNRRYRGRDAPTDILSFAGGRGPEGRHLGDVAICPAILRAQARAAGHGPERELKRLLLHGVLHCLGHDHESDDGRMERLERRLRRRWIDDG